MITRELGRHANSYFYHNSDGLYYNFLKGCENTIYFKCVHYQRGCGGRALLRLANQQFVHTQRHDHAPDMLYPQVLAARRDIVQKAREMSYVSFSDILMMERRRIASRPIRARLTLRRLRRSMQRSRALAFPNLPANLQELTVILEDPRWQSITQTEDLQDNIYCGSAVGDDGSHNILFISSRCLEIMRNVEILFGDGTFYITPSVDGCYQVFTLVSIDQHTVIPLFWCLMERKTLLAYTAVFLLLRAKLKRWRFTKVVCDFEDAIIIALETVFGVEVQGCLFHAVDDMARYARVNVGIRILIDHPNLKDIVRWCCALPLLPQHLIQRGMNIIGREAIGLGDVLYNTVRPFLLYVQHEWLNHANRGHTLSVCGSYHRTNNASESNNRRMKRRFGVHHPNIYHFIRQIVFFEDAAVDDLESLRLGQVPTRPRTVRAVSQDERIRRMTFELMQEPQPSDESMLRFLRTAAYSVENVVNDALLIARPQA